MSILFSDTRSYLIAFSLAFYFQTKMSEMIEFSYGSKGAGFALKKINTNFVERKSQRYNTSIVLNTRNVRNNGYNGSA